MDHAPPAGAPCRNCGAIAPPQEPAPRYCGQCGQEAALHPPTFGEFVHEFVGHYVALEGALWRTLGLLVARPGRLTREYLDGRRRRYVLPLRLYLTVSFVFFILLRIGPSAMHDAKSAATAMRPSPAASQPWVGSDCGKPGHPSCEEFERWVAQRVEQSRKDPKFGEHLQARMTAATPYAVFLLLPLFAWLMQLVYRNRRMTYGEHFVFSLHVHAFWFLVLAAIELLPDAIGDWLVIAPAVYVVVAMRVVYGGRWWATVGRAAVATALYGLAFAGGTAALVGGLVATG